MIPLMANQEKQKEDVCRIVLSAVQEHSGQVGVNALALLLKGSRNASLLGRELHNSRFYGGMFYYPVDVIASFAKQCLQLGLLTVVNRGAVYPVPVLTVSENGKKLMETGATGLVVLAVERRIREVKVTPAIKEACTLVCKLGSVGSVAERRGISVETAYDYLSKGIRLGLISVSDVVGMDVQKQVKAAMNCGTRLRRLKERLPGISYGEIKCVVAASSVIPNTATGDA